MVLNGVCHTENGTLQDFIVKMSAVQNGNVYSNHRGT